MSRTYSGSATDAIAGLPTRLPPALTGALPRGPESPVGRACYRARENGHRIESPLSSRIRAQGHLPCPHGDAGGPGGYGNAAVEPRLARRCGDGRELREHGRHVPARRDCGIRSHFRPQGFRPHQAIRSLRVRLRHPRRSAHRRQRLLQARLRSLRAAHSEPRWAAVSRHHGHAEPLRRKGPAGTVRRDRVRHGHPEGHSRWMAV